MTEQLISYFAKRHVLTNLIFLAVILGGFVAWQETKKEEMPAFTFDRVQVSVRYTGAPAQDVEYFVTKPIEEALRGLDGVYRIYSSSSVGSSNITIELEKNYPNIDEAILEIRAATLDVELPQEIIDEPEVRVFKTTKKAILDIALYHKDVHLLDNETRRELQKYAFALENRLLNLDQVNSINKEGYLQEELQIKVDPAKLSKYDIPFNTIMSEVRNNHLRSPSGTLSAEQEPKVTLLSELDTPDKLNQLVIQGGFEGQVIRLGEIANVAMGYEKVDTVHKVNGHEAVMFNVVKSSSYGILEALEKVNKTVERFKSDALKDSKIELVLLDDESIDVRNRLNLIGTNGTIGFILILAILFIFLDPRSGFWVAMGIPFTICFTLIFGSLAGLTINGTTLAAVIIVMGIIVDDAIIVAENITRLRHQGVPRLQSIVQGTAYMLRPITASIVTTCVAFIPLFFFEGRFGSFIQHIPPVIFLMLIASLFESILVLPGHMGLRIFPSKPEKEHERKHHWFDKVETLYARILVKVLKYRSVVLTAFILLLIYSTYLVTNEMKFVMFPHEETRDLVLTGDTEAGSTRYQTAQKVREIEDIITPYLGKEVVGFRTEVARSRRGGVVAENNFRTIVEIVPREQRDKSSDEIIAELEEPINQLEGFHKLRFLKARWGQESGSPIEIIIQQNNDDIRNTIVQNIIEKMRSHPSFVNIEVDEGFRIPEYRVSINREMIKRLAITPQDVSSTLRAALEGTVLYEFSNGDEDIHVRLTTIDDAKKDIQRVLELPVENRNNYLVPLKSIVSFEEVVSPNAISRRDMKRSTVIDADISPDSEKTPLEVADYLENQVFPEILSKYPTTNLSFGGEIQDTRESTNDFQNAVAMVVLLIYIILAVLFDSVFKPFLIMLAIPFGLVGVIIAFYLHDKGIYGFYSCVGALGLAGVVINDAIIMLMKLEDDFEPSTPKEIAFEKIAAISSTRLRAVLLTTITTVVGILPTAYGFAGFDATLAEMMLALVWGMIFGTLITLVFIPCLYSYLKSTRYKIKEITTNIS